MKDVLIIKTKSLIPKDTLQALHDNFVEQIKSGVVIIPPYFYAKLINVPDDVEDITQSVDANDFIVKKFNIKE